MIEGFLFDTIFHSLDNNKDGKLSEDEFLRSLEYFDLDLALYHNTFNDINVVTKDDLSDGEWKNWVAMNGTLMEKIIVKVVKK